MTKLYLADHQLILLVCSVGASLAAGALIGAFHFLTLRWNVWMFATGQSLPLALAVQLVRFAVIAAALAVIASHFGALPLLAVAAGVVATRTAIVGIGVRR